ncbi:MAG TPA: hypothetical protein VJ827_07325 [Rubrobacter sp.]|nr:hypothetical protein [Rubrobacter sp.]
MNRRNIVLTGTGRSGTTLACHLLNKLPNTVALSEPIPPGKFVEYMPDHEAICDQVENYYRKTRTRARKKGIAISKHVGGVVPDNTKGMVDGVRRRIAEKGKIDIKKELHQGFYLAIKQPQLFTVLLPTLKKRIPCYAIVRNPLAVRASMSSIASREDRRISAIDRYDPELARRFRSVEDDTERALLRFHTWFELYLRELPAKHILRYEDIVASGGGALSVIVPAARDLDEALENKNTNPIYDKSKVLEFGQRLLESDGAYWRLYSRDSVREIMDALS